MSPHVLEFALVGLGGAIGAMSRQGVTYMGVFDDTPYYTVAINVSGCLVIGILTALFKHFNLSDLWTFFFMGGVLGGFTTYSSFTRDAIDLVEAGMAAKALFYIAVTLIGGLGACYFGMLGTARLLR